MAGLEVRNERSEANAKAKAPTVRSIADTPDFPCDSNHWMFHWMLRCLVLKSAVMLRALAWMTGRSRVQWASSWDPMKSPRRTPGGIAKMPDAVWTRYSLRASFAASRCWIVMNWRRGSR
jgi:hypothetical protein